MIPEFVKIIQQGIAEKNFYTPYPEEAAKLVFKIANALFETIPSLVLNREQDRENINKLVRRFQVYEYFIERMIGAQKGTIHIVSRDVSTHLCTDLIRRNKGKVTK
jgi:hypothetical protein